MENTIFLIGNIEGDPFYATKFFIAAKALESAGLIVINPALLSPAAFAHEAYIRILISLLNECEAVCLLPDCKESDTAKYELGEATAQNKKIIYYDEWLITHEILSPKRTGKEAYRCFYCNRISVYTTLILTVEAAPIAVRLHI